MVSLVKILIECVPPGGNSELKQKLKLHKLSQAHSWDNSFQLEGSFKIYKEVTMHL